MSVYDGSSAESLTRSRKRDRIKSFVRSKKQELMNYRNDSDSSLSLNRTETQQIDEIIESSVPEINQPQCMLFPTYACQVNDTLYRVTLAGWAFAKPGSKKLDRFLLAAGRKYGRLDRDSIEDNHFSTLLNQFRCQTMRMTDIKLTLPGIIAQRIIDNHENHLNLEQQEKIRDYAALVNTGQSGRFQKEIILDKTSLPKSKYLAVEASFDKNSDRSFNGYVDLIEPVGVSVISDIDDTIKITDILDGKDAILKNTFFSTAREVPHMSDVYRTWASQGAHFHYVSNSPWQVFPALDEFLNKHHFPKGSMHLRSISTQQLIRGKAGSHKRQTISNILQDFPSRKFILVGDSGEIDPEIYQEIYHEYPHQIIKICIHDVTSHRAVEFDRLANQKPDSYYRLIRKFFSQESRLLKKSPSSQFAMDAMAETEIPEEQQDVADPKIPIATKLRQFEDRIKRVSNDMEEGIFTIFSKGDEIMSDSLITQELLASKACRLSM